MKPSNTQLTTIICWSALVVASANLGRCSAAQTTLTGNSTNQLGEKLILLSSGESTRGIISYGLYYVASASRAASNQPPGSDLILTMRNNGAKWIDFKDVTADNFSLRDSQGKELKVFLRSALRGIGYGDLEVVHLEVAKSTEASEPWTLTFKTPHAFVPVDLSISGIEFRKAVQKP